ncbi:MAG: hypothetical protein EOO38_15935, partial [Cytophagaceae bacterium]
MQQGGTDKGTVGDAAGDKVNFKNGTNTVASVSAEANGVTDVTFNLADNINLTSVTTGNSKLDNSGLVVKDGTGGVSVGK